jgi:hypothetical protein
MPFDQAPPRSNRFGSPLVLSRVLGVPIWVRQAARLVFRQATGPRRTEDLTSIAGCIECDAGFTWDNTGDVFRQPAVVQRTVVP